MAKDAPRRVLISGVNGQDGAYLARLCLERGDQVFGGLRTPHDSLENLERLGIARDITFLHLDFEDEQTLSLAVKTSAPDRVFNLAALSSLAVSEQDEARTHLINFAAPLHLFDLIWSAKPDARIFQASSALVFGLATESPQRETTPRAPDTYYGKAKHKLDLALEDRRLAGRFAASGLLYNHESPFRDESFVSAKIVNGLVRLKHGKARPITLGDLDAVRDWSHAEDFCRAMQLTLEAEKPEDRIFASGQKRTVRDWIDRVGMRLDFLPKYSVKGDQALVHCGKTNTLLAQGQRMEGAPEAAFRVGDPQKLKTDLNWQPKYTFDSLVKHMVDEAQSQLT